MPKQIVIETGESKLARFLTSNQPLDHQPEQRTIVIRCWMDGTFVQWAIMPGLVTVDGFPTDSHVQK